MFTKKSKTKKATLWQRIGYHFISCANICSIHGFCHIVRKNVSFYERVLWFLMVTFASAWCIDLALQAWDHYQTRPTVISLERNHWKWNTPFPAITLCLNGIENDKAEELMAELKISPDDDEFKQFLRALVNVDFETFKDFDKYSNLSVYQNVESYVDWAIRTSSTLGFPVGIQQSFGELREFQTILTEMGVCFAYNSRIAVYNTPTYWAKGTTKPVEVDDIVLINPGIQSPMLMITHLSTGFKIFFHGPNEFPDTNTKKFYVTDASFSYYDLALGTVWTSPEVKQLAISQRQCRLLDEPDSEHTSVYSYDLCKIECRRNICLKLCNCTPFYYKRWGKHTFEKQLNVTDSYLVKILILGKEPICNPIGMRCLYKHKASIKGLKNHLDQSVCSCLQDCDVDRVTVTRNETHSFFLHTNLQLSVTQYPTVRFKRSLIFSRTNLLVQIGGVFGLFLGCSVLSLIELVYFFTLRFFWGVIKERTI